MELCVHEEIPCDVIIQASSRLVTNTDQNCIKLEQYLQHKLFFLSKSSPWGLLGAYVHARERESGREGGEILR